ncbi:MAG: transposase, partial [Chloroflexi bacterium]|nr:transposase [Chloroflexota bacterium]
MHNRRWARSIGPHRHEVTRCGAVSRAAARAAPTIHASLSRRETALRAASCMVGAALAAALVRGIAAQLPLPSCLWGTIDDSAGKFGLDNWQEGKEEGKYREETEKHDARRRTMSLPLHPLEPIPDLTRQIACTSFPKGTLAMHLRDELGSIYQDEQFADLFPKRGRAAEAPWRLALVTVLQAMENLSDRQAAEMVRGRLDWKYALSLPLDDSGFDASILTDFRQRLVDQQAQERLLEPILAVCRTHGWLRAGGTQRVDSTMVLASARRLSSLESVGETLRAALNALAETEPEWLLTVISADWFERYVHRFELQRFPKGTQVQEALREQVGRDGWTVLQAVQRPDAPPSVRSEPLVAVLERVWLQHFAQVEGQVRWRDGPSVSNAERVVSPYDQQARESRKRETEWLGYKVHLT